MPSYSLPAISIRLHPEDDVVVLKQALQPGDSATDGSQRWEVTVPIGRGHKMATRDIAEGAAVRRYGQVIGFASQPIARGTHVHTHNVLVRDFSRAHAIGTGVTPLPPLEPGDRKSVV